MIQLSGVIAVYVVTASAVVVALLLNVTAMFSRKPLMKAQPSESAGPLDRVSKAGGSSLPSLTHILTLLRQSCKHDSSVESLLKESLKALNCKSFMYFRKDAVDWQLQVSVFADGDVISVDPAVRCLLQSISINHISEGVPLQVFVSMEKTGVVLCCPVVIDGAVVGAVCCIASTQLEELHLQYLSSCCSSILQREALTKSLSRRIHKADTLKEITMAFWLDESIESILTVVVESLYTFMGPELISLYLCSEREKEAWICLSKDGLEGLTVSFGQGIAGTVAMNGGCVVVTDAYADARFCRDVDNMTGTLTRNMICFSIPGFSKGSAPVAVLQLINIRDDDYFNEFYVSFLNELSALLSKMLHRKLYELKLFKISSHLRNHPEKQKALALETDLLNHYGTVVKNPLSVFFTPAPSPMKNGKNAFLSPHHMDKYKPDLFSWHFCPFDKETSFLINCSKLLFERLDSLQKFSIEEVVFKNFLLSVSKMYHDVPFHNFQHAWSVCHVCLMILIDAGLDEILQPIVLIAILLSALCHDVDHPGNTNTFEICRRSELAVLYSDDAVLERHHCALANQLICSPNHDLMANMSISDRGDLRRVVTISIMGTEMSKHFQHVEELHSISARPNWSEMDKTAQAELSAHVLHCADLSGQVMIWSISKIWGERCIQEFRDQAEKEEILGYPITPFMQGLNDKRTAMELQSGFIDNIVLPLWKALADCFPELESRVIQCLEISGIYKNEIMTCPSNCDLGHDSDSVEQTQGEWKVINTKKRKKK